MRMKTDLMLKHPEFYSDLNGYQFVQRRTNSNGRIEANYFPLTTGAFVDDGVRRVSLLSAQPHGVAGLEANWLEVMLDRQLMYDDNRGLGEGVEDIKPVTSEFILLVEKRESGTQAWQLPKAHHAFPSLLSLSLNDRLQQPLQIFYSTIDSDIFFSPLEPFKMALPCDVSLLSLRSLATGNLQYNGTSLILHRRAYDCDFPVKQLQCSTLIKSLTFESLFSELKVGMYSVEETTLTHLHHRRSLASKDSIELQPMKISAFHVVF